MSHLRAKASQERAHVSASRLRARAERTLVGLIGAGEIAPVWIERKIWLQARWLY